MQTQQMQLEQLYRDYIAQCRKLSAAEPIGARFLSPGKDARNHPCHQEFYDSVRNLLEQFLQQGIDEGEHMLRWMLEAPYLHAGEEAQWYLLAVQRHAVLLIPGLDAPTRRRIGRWYKKLVPSHQRLPIQDELIRMLGA